MTTTHYAIKSTNDELWVFRLAPLTNPAATEDVRKAKTWATKSGARAAIERHGLTNVEVVEVAR